jgi:hypothetical protein
MTIYSGFSHKKIVIFHGYVSLQDKYPHFQWENDRNNNQIGQSSGRESKFTGVWT